MLAQNADRDDETSAVGNQAMSNQEVALITTVPTPAAYQQWCALVCTRLSLFSLVFPRLFHDTHHIDYFSFALSRPCECLHRSHNVYGVPVLTS
jgi:hypothetical protein